MAITDAARRHHDELFRARLIEVVTQLLPSIGSPRSLNAITAITDVIPPAPATSEEEKS